MGNILMDVRAWAAILLVAAVLIGLHFYNKSQELANALIIQKATQVQNETALRDSLTKSAQVVQTMTARVANLQTDSTRLRKEGRVLVSTYKSYIDSIRRSGSTTVVFEKDSLGEFVKASFSGKEYIATYHGYTKTYITPLSTEFVSTYQLSLDFDVIQTQSELLRNDSTGVFFIRTTSLTEGIVLIGYSTIDSSAFPALYGSGKIQAGSSGGSFFVGGMINQDMVQLGFAVKSTNWLFVLNYKVFEKLLSQANQAWYERLQLGTYYNPF